MACAILLSCSFESDVGRDSQILLLPLTMTASERTDAEQRAEIYMDRLLEFSRGVHGDARSVEENEERFLKAAYQLTTLEERSMAVAAMHEGGLLSEEGKGVRANLYIEDLACIMPVTGLHEMGGVFHTAAIGCVLGAFYEFLSTHQTGAALLYHKHKLPSYEIAGTIWIWRF